MKIAWIFVLFCVFATVYSSPIGDEERQLLKSEAFDEDDSLEEIEPPDDDSIDDDSSEDSNDETDLDETEPDETKSDETEPGETEPNDVEAQPEPETKVTQPQSSTAENLDAAANLITAIGGAAKDLLKGKPTKKPERKKEWIIRMKKSCRSKQFRKRNKKICDRYRPTKQPHTTKGNPPKTRPTKTRPTKTRPTKTRPTKAGSVKTKPTRITTRQPVKTRPTKTKPITTRRTSPPKTRATRRPRPTKRPPRKG